MPHMEGEGLLTAIGGLAISIAGFAGLAAAFGSADWTPFEAFRIRLLLAQGLSVAFESFLPAISFRALHDEPRALVLSSAIVVLWTVTGLVARTLQVRPRRGSGIHWLTLFGPAVIIISIAVQVANVVVWASVAAYAAALLIQLIPATVSFYWLLSERTTARR